MEKVKSFFRSRLSVYEPIIVLLILGIVVRVLISFFTSHPNDEEVWYIVAVNMLSGQGTPFGTWYFAYPPVWAYTFIPFVGASTLFSNPYLFYVQLSVNGSLVPVLAPLFNFALKLPIIIGDILVGLFIYHFVSEYKDADTAKAAFIFWFFNPLVIFTSAAVAQFDVLPALASLLGFIFFVQRKYLFSGMSLAIGVFSKIYPIFFVPLYLAFLFKPDENKKIKLKKSLVSSISLISGFLLTAALLLIPVLLSNSFHQFYDGIFRRSEYIISVGGLTPIDALWMFTDAITWSNELGRPQIIYGVLTALQLIGIASFLVYFVFKSKQEDSTKNLLRGQVCILVLIFLTSVTVNPQYIIWILPFLILGYGVYGNYRIRISLLSASACFLGFFWAYPLHPITVFVNQELGNTLNRYLNLSQNLSPTIFSIGIFFGLLGAGAILLLPFPNLENTPEAIPPRIRAIFYPSRREDL